jgi:glycosyltransferase involved in cell wall biosynthesis
MDPSDVPAPNQLVPVRRISVVTVCLNAADAIEQTLASVREQRFADVEHVVIDGASTDGTLEILHRHQPELLISEPDSGLYYAMQKGALAATGDALFFLNAGDVFADDNVLKDVAAFFDRTGADAVFGNLLPVYVGANLRHDHVAFHEGQTLDLSYFNNRRLFHEESVHHQTVFYRRKIFEHCGFICEDPKANGEYFLNCCAFVHHGFSMKHFPRTICRFALGGRSTSNFEVEWKKFETARQILRARFFPKGPNVPLPAGPDEYLVELPSLRNRVKIATRGTRLAKPLAWFAHHVRVLAGRLLKINYRRK